MKTCQHCGDVSDDTRVFCANCGTRLPAMDSESDTGSAGKSPTGGVAPAVGRTTAPPLPGASGPNAKKAVSPKHGKNTFGSLFSTLVSTAVLAALLACMVQIFREPDHLPPASGIDVSAANGSLSVLKGLATAATPAKWAINNRIANQFLETTVEMKSANGAIPAPLEVEFQRAFVLFRSGSFGLGVDQKFLGRDFYFVLNVEPENSGSGLGARLNGGSIGRLPVHPALTPVFLKFFQPTIAGLSGPVEYLKQAKSVIITPDDATLEWAGTGKSSAP